MAVVLLASTFLVGCLQSDYKLAQSCPLVDGVGDCDGTVTSSINAATRVEASEPDDPAAATNEQAPTPAYASAEQQRLLGVKNDLRGEGERSKVLASLADADPGFSGRVPTPANMRLGAAEEPVQHRFPAPRRPRGQLLLRDAVALAVTSHPQIGAQASKVIASQADINISGAAQKPTLEVYGGGGGGVVGNYSNGTEAFSSGSASGAPRVDAGFALKQLLYDFGAAREDQQRTRHLMQSEKWKLADLAEDISLRTVNAYLNLLEQKELLGLIGQTVQSYQSLAEVVKLNKDNGNGTEADLQRIRSKVIEIESLRTDIETQARAASDEFARLTGVEASNVQRPGPVKVVLPPSPARALAEARSNHPGLAALDETRKSSEAAIESKRSEWYPKVVLQSDALLKNYYGSTSTTNQSYLDGRAMAIVSYKLMDGGLAASQLDRLNAERQASEFKLRDQQETLALEVNKNYRALAAARSKTAATGNGVKSSGEANKLYMEQFKAGKRTVFEVLDSHMSVFNMRKASINSTFEDMRARYAILRSLGRLTETLAKSG